MYHLSTLSHADSATKNSTCTSAAPRAETPQSMQRAQSQQDLARAQTCILLGVSAFR